jgi:hypothetical protein
MLLAMSARSAGQAAQGFIVELLARASRLVQQRAAARLQAASTRCYMARGGNAMAHDDRWTGVHTGGVSTQHVAGSTMGIRLVMTRRHGARGMGEDYPDRWAPSVSNAGTIIGGRWAHA